MNRRQYNGFTPSMRNPTNYGHNYNRAFNGNPNLIPSTDFTNKNDVLHNNLHEELLKEDMVTYNIYVDGYHRNHTTHTNPFNFPVYFGDRHKVVVIQSDGTTTKEANDGVTIGFPLKNIKFVKILNVFFPRYTKINYNLTDSKFEYVTDETDFDLNNSVRFLTLKIKELEDLTRFSTGDFHKDDTFILRADKTLGADHYLYIPVTNDTKTYKHVRQNRLSKLSVQIYDDTDTLLTGPTLTYYPDGDTSGSLTTSTNINFNTLISDLTAVQTAITGSDTSSSQVNPYTGTDGDIDDVNTTLAQLETLKRRHQIQINMDIGLMDNTLNTKFQFSR